MYITYIYIFKFQFFLQVGCETVITVSFQHLILPDQKPPHTSLLDIHPVPRSALNNKIFESIYKMKCFNPIQSQVFVCMYMDIHVYLFKYKHTYVQKDTKRYKIMHIRIYVCTYINVHI
jgi:hypothetical protein